MSTTGKEADVDAVDRGRVLMGRSVGSRCSSGRSRRGVVVAAAAIVGCAWWSVCCQGVWVSEGRRLVIGYDRDAVVLIGCLGGWMQPSQSMPCIVDRCINHPMAQTHGKQATGCACEATAAFEYLHATRIIARNGRDSPNGMAFLALG